MLQRLVDELAPDLPDGGFCARYGGEEFALVLPDRDLAAAVRDLRGRPPPHRPPRLGGAATPSLRVTVSIGVAHGPAAGDRGRAASSDAADLLLYAAKHAGRNAVAYRDPRTGLVRLAGAAARRRAIPQTERTTG